MTANSSETTSEMPEIRETYAEYDVGSETVGMISDTENEYAWIQSTEVRPVEP